MNFVESIIQTSLTKKFIQNGKGDRFSKVLLDEEISINDTEETEIAYFVPKNSGTLTLYTTIQSNSPANGTRGRAIIKVYNANELVSSGEIKSIQPGEQESKSFDFEVKRFNKYRIVVEQIAGTISCVGCNIYGYITDIPETYFF